LKRREDSVVSLPIDGSRSSPFKGKVTAVSPLPWQEGMKGRGTEFHGAPPGLTGDICVKAMNRIKRSLDSITGALVLILVTIIFINVILRYVFSVSYPAMSEIIGYLTVWMVFISAGTLCSRNEHISMGFLRGRFSKKANRFLDMIIAVAGILISAKVVQIGLNDTLRIYNTGQTSPSGALPSFISYLSIPVGFALVAVFYLVYLIRRLSSEDTP
jgi:TRAP-type C4-dicarboxylate transport system permease small subunit